MGNLSINLSSEKNIPSMETLLNTFSDGQSLLPRQQLTILSSNPTASSYGVKLDKTGEDLDVEAKQVSVYLHQEDTLKFRPGTCEAMINWKYPDGNRGSSDPDHPIKFVVNKNLLDQVI